MVNSEGTIHTAQNRSCSGKNTHDYEIFKNKHPTTPMQVENILDLGYMGVKNDFPTVKYVYYHLERKGKVNCQVEKRNIIESIPN